MSTEDTHTGARRHSTGLVVGAGLLGVVIGAIVAFAITGLVFTVRVELPPPPYPPQLSSVPTPGGYPVPSPALTASAPASTPAGLPLPPPPHS